MLNVLALRQARLVVCWREQPTFSSWLRVNKWLTVPEKPALRRRPHIGIAVLSVVRSFETFELLCHRLSGRVLFLPRSSTFKKKCFFLELNIQIVVCSVTGTYRDLFSILTISFVVVRYLRDVPLANKCSRFELNNVEGIR